MGNVDKRAKHSEGYLLVQSSKPFYYPGEMCQGTVYMRVEKPLDVTHVLLKVKGKEKGSFWEREAHTVQENGQSRTEYRDVKRKAEREFIQF
mmetsp:Transcript_6553/g.4924  ORF Transcript_6553/g.4924 Transcript_6553/m.4924 type:complete len:92 (+) Transcript_6553:7-282(+)